jgi:hypothetical protein
LKVARRMEHLSVWFMPASRKSTPNVIPAKAGIQEDRSVKKGWTPASAGVTISSDKKDWTPAPAPDSDPRFAGVMTLSRFIPDDPTPISGPMFRVSADRLYEELVPFGPAYRNVKGDVFLAERAISATVSGGDHPEAEGPLGSPFPLDAAMHAACAWGQRYRNRVVFPIGFDRREIFAPTRTGESYLCRIAPLTDEGVVLRFDIRLYGCDGRPVEVIRGLSMRDIFGGRMTPPAWVGEGV